jgi:hypothetical protein
MNLPSPVTITPPSFTRADGEVRTFTPITLTSLDVTLVDNATRRICEARIRPCPQPLVLWRDAAYDAVGDYTQSQAEARILELLGEDVAARLEGLFRRA